MTGNSCVLTAYLPTCAASCLVAAVRRCKGGDGRGERGRCGRLFEATKIATTDDKMLVETVLNNTVWTSADAERISLLLNRPAMCGSALNGAHQHHLLVHLVNLIVHLEQLEFDDVTNTEALMEGQVALATTQLHLNSSFPLRLVRLPNGMLCVVVSVERSACV